MPKFNCFSTLVGRKKKKEKGNKSSSNTDDYQKMINTLQVRLEGSEKCSENDKMKSKSVSFGISGSSRDKAKVMSHESPIDGEASEVAYEGEDEHEENLSLKRDNSDFNLQAQVGDLDEETDRSTNEKKMEFYDRIEKNAEKDVEEGVDLIQTGHASDPGIGKAEFWGLPKLKRSCSNLETRDLLKNIAADQLPPSNSRSLKVLKRLSERFGDQVFDEIPHSPRSVMTHCSADKVMLKKHSSSQVLPSRSRSLWWKLFLWNHRNPRGGYCSDTLETNRSFELEKMESPGSFTGGEELVNRETNNDSHRSWDGFRGGVSGFLPQNQWVAFSTKSPLRRVDEWVKDLATQPPLPVSDDNDSDGRIVFPPSQDTGKLPANVSRRPNLNVSEEILYANSVIQSLNSSSVVAHITGIGLKVMPTLSGFSSLRSVNLSGNSIVHITPGSLPKGLQTLNLSRNKISTIEGFRELNRLRVLDLSYNRISRIGRGLSNCTLIKELYLAGNKISVVEGLHRLLKLTVLDLSFNKIITTKALGQIVANYHSLLALNLLGNPIQSNISDDQLRKAVCSLFPKLAYLNKQPISPQKAREVPTESIAKAALGRSRSKAMKRVMSQGGQSSRQLTKSRTHRRPMEMKASELASSSR